MTDIHDTNLPEKQVELEEEKKTAEVLEPVQTETAAEETAVENNSAETPQRLTKEDVIDKLREISGHVGDVARTEIENLKQIFYKLHNAEQEAAKRKFVDEGGAVEDFTPQPDPLEEEMKRIMSVIREKRSEQMAELEKQKEMNLQVKLSIIEELKDLLESPDDANKNYTEFKRLQQQWNEVKLVPQGSVNELWKNYQLYVEKFYDLLKLNNEFREYDFKKNLEIKTHLCEAAEKLADEPDAVSAFYQLQKLHQDFRETGPVAKELRDEIWARFKAASTVINKRHQQHFEELRSKEEENLTKKTALCEKVEEIAKEEIKNAGDWDKKTKEIIAIQAEWKTIGFAPQKMNVKIFERFRAACDDFFGRKADYFKELKQKFAENAEKKKALVEQAQALQDSTDWKATSDKLVALQKEWKTIGMVPKKLGDKLWSDFLTACNHFFDARNNANAGTRTEERANLEKKREIISQLKALADNAEEDIQEKVRELVDQYNVVGHVPFKEKDNVYKEYHDILDRLYKELNITTARRRLDKFKSNLKNVPEKGADALDNERSRLMRRYEQLKQEVQTYENNIGFLNASSKKGNSLIDEMNRKVQKLKDDMNLVREKIKAIDAEN